MLPGVDIPHEDSSFELHSAISIEGWEGKPSTTKTGCRRMLQVPTHFEFSREADTTTDLQQQSVSAGHVDSSDATADTSTAPPPAR
jgi:hypothetical protein